MSNIFQEAETWLNNTQRKGNKRHFYSINKMRENRGIEDAKRSFQEDSLQENLVRKAVKREDLNRKGDVIPTSRAKMKRGFGYSLWKSGQDGRFRWNNKSCVSKEEWKLKLGGLKVACDREGKMCLDNEEQSRTDGKDTLQNHNIYLINAQYVFITFSPNKL